MRRTTNDYMTGDEQQPILTKWHQSPQEEEKIGGGVESEEKGVVRKVFGTSEGLRSYVEKQIRDAKEAKRVMELYRQFQSWGLPVVSFAKIIKRKEEGKDSYFLAMEDLTEQGRYKTTELVSGRIGGISKSARLINFSENPKRLQHQLVQALAVFHNNRVYDEHPGLSFLLRWEKKNPQKVPFKLDFRIIDYSNFRRFERVDGSHKQTFSYQFENECEKDLQLLLRGIVYASDQYHELKSLYTALREQGQTKYNQDFENFST